MADPSWTVWYVANNVTNVALIKSIYLLSFCLLVVWVFSGK